MFIFPMRWSEYQQRNYKYCPKCNREIDFKQVQILEKFNRDRCATCCYFQDAGIETIEDYNNWLRK